MAIILSHPLTTPEIRVLQEYRRISADTIPLAALKAIKHPVGGGEAPVLSLVEKGFLTTADAGVTFTVTQKAKDFLVLDPVPMFEGGAAAAVDAE